MMSLRDRIHDQLEPQIVRFLRGKPRLKLVPIVGNGITRMAGGDSWDKWIRKVLGIVDQPERFDALRRKGFEHPEILNYAFEKATESHLQEMWRQFAAQLYGLSPSNLHQAIALMADCHIATTNYDDLLERGAGDRYNPDYVIKPESKLPDPYAPQPGDVVISKLHGSLPPKDELEEWIKNKGYDNLITTSVSYKKAVFRPKGTPGPFVRLEEALEQDDHIFLFLGTSLTPAELFLFRILYRRQNPPDNLATLHFGSDADPPIRLEELGIKPFTVHRGLASSADRRKLAYLVLLKLLLDKIDIPDDRKAKADESLRNGHAALPCNLLVNRRLGEISPVVGCIGPLQVSRVIGIKTAPQEEAFFGPVEGSAEPGSAQTEDLISDAAIGQGGTEMD